MIAQEGRIIGNGHQDEDRDQKWHTQSPGAPLQEDRRSSSRQAAEDEQSGDEKHEGHKKTVIEHNDEIEAEPAHSVAMAKVGVVDDRVMQHHQQRDEGARAVERSDVHRRLHAVISYVYFWFMQHHCSEAASSAVWRRR